MARLVVSVEGWLLQQKRRRGISQPNTVVVHTILGLSERGWEFLLLFLFHTLSSSIFVFCVSYNYGIAPKMLYTDTPHSIRASLKLSLVGGYVCARARVVRQYTHDTSTLFNQKSRYHSNSIHLTIFFLLNFFCLLQFFSFFVSFLKHFTFDLIFNFFCHFDRFKTKRQSLFFSSNKKNLFFSYTRFLGHRKDF